VDPQQQLLQQPLPTAGYYSSVATPTQPPTVYSGDPMMLPAKM